MRILKCAFWLFAALLAGCSGPAFQQPNGSFTLQTRSEMLGTDGTEPEEALVVGSGPAILHFSPDPASKALGEVAVGTGVIVTAHVLVDGSAVPWLLIRAGDKEGYLTTDQIDLIYRKKAGLALLRVGAEQPGEPLLAEVVLEKNFQLADGTLVPRDQVALLNQPAFLEADASWVVVDGPLSAYSRFYDRNSEVTLPSGTRGTVLGVSDLPADPRAALSPFHSPALVRTQDGTLVFVSLSSLLLHPQTWGDGLIGSRSVVRFQLRDPFLGRYGRLEAWSKDGKTLLSEGENEPGDIASVESRDAPPAGKSVKVVRRLQARTTGGIKDAPPAESVLEDWYAPDPAAEAPWGFRIFSNTLSLSFTALIDGVEETHQLKISGMADRFKGNAGELLGSYTLSTWVPPSDEPEHSDMGEEYGEGDGEGDYHESEAEPDTEAKEFSGSLSFALTVNKGEGGFSLGTDGRFTDVDLPESRKPESSDEFWNTISRALDQGVGEASGVLFPIWYP